MIGLENEIGMMIGIGINISIWIRISKKIIFCFHLNQDLSSDETLAGRPGTWLLKKRYILYACNQKN